MDYMNKLFKVEKKESGVAIFTLDNPPVNTISLDVTTEQIDTFLKADKDKDIRVIILAAAGTKAFCAGSDIKEFPDLWDDIIYKKLKRENEAYNLIEQISKPVIAAIEGLAYGGGCELALTCDMRICSTEAKFALPEINLGVMPGTGGVLRMPQVVGLSKAREMMYTGLPIPADEALRFGLVSRVVPAGQAAAEAVKLAEIIAKKPALSLAQIKKYSRALFHKTAEESFWEHLEMSVPGFLSPDSKEGVAAFMEKRPAKFH